MTSKERIREADKEAILVLEDGTVVQGVGFGAFTKTYGEVVFNTGMVGYTEALTDPSYHGQILVQTYPLIGNYGVSQSHFESNGPKVRGYVIHELCREPSHWSAEMTLDEWLERSGIPGIEGVDTRMLTKKLRVKGTLLGVLVVRERGDLPDLEELKREAKTVPDPNERALAYEVATSQVKNFNVKEGKDVVLVDCGVKSSIITNIMARGYNVIQVPPKTSAAKIMGLEPEAVVLSNGPGDPKMYTEVIETTATLVKEEIPLLGICLGSQIVGLSLNVDTYKLKFGHRGHNHPCIDVKTGRCYITSQNHGYVLDAKTLDTNELTINMINANDKTIEAIEHNSLLIRAVQFHPEGTPGPLDTNFYFDQFFQELRQRRWSPL
ncbi:MAG: glutamine-hydrolyzing carbamoyl-phosphate synthase small subunit [Candidatus Bathyarchaeia archaeon]